VNQTTTKIIFLDIDGVLNNHVFDRIAGSATILPVCVGQLNRLIHATGAKVVLSSAWRYMCIDGTQFPAGMTLKGFEYMLRTHGVTQRISIIGHTEPDCDVLLGADRGHQICRWLLDNRYAGKCRYVVIDDRDLGISVFEHPFVQTVASKGLTAADADKAIDILGRLP
jgi:hypothetical protein